MSFWDNVKKFAQPYSEEDYDDYDEEMEEYEEEAQEAPVRSGRRPSPFATAATESEPAPAASAAAATSTGFSGQVLNMSSGKQEVVLFHAKTFDDAAMPPPAPSSEPKRLMSPTVQGPTNRHSG